MIRHFLSILLLSISLVGVCQLKVITFNIRLETTSDGNNQWDLRKSSVVDFLNYEDADFIGMQEVLWSQMEDLQKGIDSYSWIGVGRDDGKKGGEFSPIFYNSERWDEVESKTFWLSESPDKPSKSWDAALPRICTWGRFRNIETKDEVYIFNTHFDHVGKEARTNSAKLIVEQIHQIANSERVILFGDFNAEVNSAPIQAVVNSSLLDAFDEAQIRFGSVGTFNAFDYSKTPKRRIDYVFVSSDLEVESYGVASHLIDGRYLSDHFPVIVKIH